MPRNVIIPSKKIRFNIEIDLSEQQLKYLCEYSGDDEYNDLDYYKDLSADNFDKVVTLNPSFCMGLGADINSILSVGFETLSKIDTEMKTKLLPEDLTYHPFMCKRNEIISIESKLIDCEVLTEYIPMTEALNQDGEIISLDPNIDEKINNLINKQI